MILSMQNIHRFLLNKGLVESQNLFQQDYIARQLFPYKPIYHVRSGIVDYCLKQADFNSSWSIKLMPNYGLTLQIINEIESFNELKRVIPKFYNYDYADRILTTTFYNDHINLDEYQRMSGVINQDILNKVINITSKINVDVSSIQDSRISLLPHEMPWILEITKKDSQEKELIARHNSIVQACFQNLTLTEVINTSRSFWQAKSLIHGDIKWGNFLIHQFSGDPSSILLTDWETADIGDPIWDLAGIIQNVISNQILNVGPRSIGRFPKYLVERECSSLKLLIIKIWRTYYQYKHSDITSKEHFHKAMVFTSARLIQTASEANLYAPSINPDAFNFLEVSKYLFTNKDDWSSSIDNPDG